MNKLISKTIFSFFFIFTLSMPVMAAQAVTTDVIAKAELDRKNEPANKVIQSLKGCELSNTVEKTAKFFSGDKSATPVVCNENIHEDYSEVDAITRIILLTPALVTFLIALMFGFAFKKIEMIAGKPTNYTRYTILLIITVFLTAPWYESTTKNGSTTRSSTIEMLALIIFKMESDDVNKRVAEMVENKLYYFATIRLPDYNGLTGQFESLLDFMIASNGVEDDKPFTFYFTDKNGDLYGRIHSGKYSGSLTLPIDQNCVKLANEYGLFDCRQKQIDWYKQYVAEALTRVNAAKNNYLVGFNNASSVLSKTFDMKMSCDNIEGINLTVYNQRDINGIYLKKVAMCISQDFTYKMHKLKNITTEAYLTNNNYLKSRRVSLCAHDQSGAFKYTGFTRSESLEKVKTCVAEACGADGSPYMCSAAVATFHSLQRSQTFYWHRIPAYLVGDVNINFSYNAETFGRRFMFEYEESGDTDMVNNDAQSVFTLSYPKIQGYEAAEYGYLETLKNWAGEQWQYYMGVAMDFNMDQLNTLGNIGQDGWMGMTKLSTCVANPHKYVDGYLCGGVLQEAMSTGAVNLKGGFDMLVSSTASLGKIKGTKNSTAAEIAQSKNFIQKVVPLKSLGIVAYFMATSAENNIYSTNGGGLDTTAVNAGILLASAVGGPEITTAIRTVGWAKIGLGVLLYFMLPFFILSRFLQAIAELLLHFGMSLTLALLNFIEAPFSTGSISNTFSRRDNDIPDFVITVFLLISFPVHMLLTYYFTDFFMNNMFSVYPVSIMEVANFLTSGSLSQGSAAASFGTNTINALVAGFIIVIHFMLYFSVIRLIPMLQGWFLFSNGEYSTDGENDEDVKRYMSKF
ncbi:hypothetical protein [Pseudomonas sp. HY7a-MNA-CIBAN-0227]|uniref:hypothetical protein n=1 Tax=Pseudomonas sp. HY7a-MNA-CIBAN-0227 TaxID=3140474 RepID=UPI00332435B8